MPRCGCYTVLMSRYTFFLVNGLFVFLLALTGCGMTTPTPGSGEPTPANAGAAGAFATDLFSISYPEGWDELACSGYSDFASHDRDLKAEPLACLASRKDKGTGCIVFFKDAADPAAIDVAYDRIYSQGQANLSWRIKSKLPVTIDGRPSREVRFWKPIGEPYFAMRDVWVPAEGGAYILTCETYASSYRTVEGQQVTLEDLYASLFDSIIQSFHIKGQAAPTAGPQETDARGATAEPTARATLATLESNQLSTAEALAPGPACSFVASGVGPIAGWTWLTDAEYRDNGLWECTGLPVGAPLPITLTTLVTNRADGGSGYSAPVRVTARPSAGGPEWTAQIYWQNPAPTQNPANSHGAGYPTTGYFVLPADYVGAGGALQLKIERLATTPDHVAVQRESLHFDAPRPASAYAARGPVIAGWTWLRDRADDGYGEWVFAGLQPGLPAVLALDLLVTDGTNGGAGYSAPVALTVSEKAADAAPQVVAVQAQNLLFEAESGDSGGRGYQAYGSLAVDPRLVDSGGVLVVRLTRPPETDRPVAVNQNSVRIVQLGSTLGAGPAAAPATPAPGQDQASCEALGGKWGPIGLSPREECNLPTSDAGKRCLDSASCEGTCLAALTQDELDAVMRENKVILAAGKCSAWRIVVGCIGTVENGVVRAICLD